MPYGVDNLAESPDDLKAASRKEVFSSPGKSNVSPTGGCGCAHKKKKPGLKIRFEEDSMQEEANEEVFKHRQKRFEEHVKHFLNNVNDSNFDKLGEDIPDFIPK